MLLGIRSVGGGGDVARGLLKHFIPICQRRITGDLQSIICVIYTPEIIFFLTEPWLSGCLRNAVNKSEAASPWPVPGRRLRGWMQSEGEREEMSGISTSCP